MPDITITINSEDVIVLESFYSTAEEGVLVSAKEVIKRCANNIIKQSPSKLDPIKLNESQLRAEISLLNIAGSVPSYEERSQLNP